MRTARKKMLISLKLHMWKVFLYIRVGEIEKSKLVERGFVM